MISKPNRIVRIGNVLIKDIVIYKKKKYKVIGFKEGKIVCLIPFNSDKIDHLIETTISMIIKN